MFQQSVSHFVALTFFLTPQTFDGINNLLSSPLHPPPLSVSVNVDEVDELIKSTVWPQGQRECVVRSKVTEGQESN